MDSQMLFSIIAHKGNPFKNLFSFTTIVNTGDTFGTPCWPPAQQAPSEKQGLLLKIRIRTPLDQILPF